MKNCNCYSKVTDAARKKLDAPEGQIDYAMTLVPEMRMYPRLRFLYHKTKNGVPQKKESEHTIIPTYCPFCGKKYNREK